MANFSTSINLNISSNDYSDFGGLAYFLAYISDYLPYVALSSIGAVIGIIGNLIIILTIIMNKELHSPTYMLMFNLAIADILVSGFVDSTTVFSVFIGKAYFVNRPSLCVFFGIVCFLGCNTSLVNLALLSVNRYINICHNNLYKKTFTKKLTLLYCLITWIIGFFDSLPNLTGWSYYSYDEKTLNCMFSRLASLSFNWYLTIVCVTIPCMLTVFFYVNIFVYSHKSKSKSKSSNSSQSSRLAKGLFVSFMVYAMCWMPYGLVVLIDFQDRFPRSVIMYTMTLGHFNSSLNPIIYFVFNSAYRSGCLNLIKKVFCCRSRINRISTIGNLSNTNSLVKIPTRALY